MYKVGMYGGSFNPLHLGHISCIIQASNCCEILYVVLSHSEIKDEIPYQERFRWLTQVTKDIPNVKVIHIKDDSKSKEDYDWAQGAENIKTMIGKDIDAVFYGSDYGVGNNPFHDYYPDAACISINRYNIPISSTDIRRNPFSYWRFIPKEVRPYYTKKVLIVGSESCGKSTLTRNLAKYYSASYVEEIGREVCEFAGGIDNMIPSDFVEILYSHKLAEIKGMREGNTLLFIDTDCTVTDYYLKLQFEDSDVNISAESLLASAIANLNTYDLILYLEPDVAWVQDGTRTYGTDDVREANNTKLKSMLKQKQYAIPYY